MPVLTFPLVRRGNVCFGCGQLTAKHRDARGHWIGCDSVIGRDQVLFERRLRLLNQQLPALQGRARRALLGDA